MTRAVRQSHIARAVYQSHIAGLMKRLGVHIAACYTGAAGRYDVM